MVRRGVVRHVIAFKNGATISGKHVGTTGSHRDDSSELHLDGIAARTGP
jgi:hypothetical protein